MSARQKYSHTNKHSPSNTVNEIISNARIMYSNENIREQKKDDKRTTVAMLFVLT